VLILIAATPGCGSSKRSDERSTSASPPAAATTTATATTGGGGIDPLEGAATTPVSSKSSAAATSLLQRVSLGRHEGFDRVVFEFRNAVPGYRVEYVQPPITQDGSGHRVDVPAPRRSSCGWSRRPAST
jgi:hypothetical protein